MFELWVLVPSVIVSGLIGLFVLSRDFRSPLNIVYALLTASFIVLSVANFMTIAPSAEMLNYVNIVITCTTLGVGLLFLLVRMIKIGSVETFRDKYTIFIIIFTIIVAVLDASSLVFVSLDETGATSVPVAGPAVIFFISHFVLTLSVVLWDLSTGILGKNKSLKRQYKAIIIGVSPILLLAPITSFILPVIFKQTALIAISPIYILWFVSTIGYSIVRHGLFDIRLAAVRTVAYTLSLAAMSAVYFFLAYVASITVFQENVSTGVSMSPVNIAIALLLAFIFQPIKQFFDKTTDDIFFRDRYSTDDFITRMGAVLTSTTKLHRLLEDAADEIATTLKASYVVFVVHRIEHGDVVAGAGTMPDCDREDCEALEQAMDSAEESVIVVDDQELDSSHSIKQRSDLKRIHHHRISLIVPLGDTIGYILVGEHKASGYTKRDVRVLETIRDELVIAIQNARSVQEVRDINASLEQRIELATKELRRSNEKLRELDTTKDEFMSMASHQLRTPLTSIKGYLSMVLEGDAGKITPTQRKLLAEAFMSSERMVHLIGDFLNVSRLQTGKFIIDQKPTNLAELVAKEVESIERLAQTHEVTLSYHQPKTFPTLMVDEEKIRQVIMNFVDNAIYYSRKKSIIAIKVRATASEVIVEVHDHGIGVPEAAKKELFGKFFRAENARLQRPDGTGVGLFLAKKVITAHGGDVIFESTEGRGSVFGFRLPIKKLRVH